MASAANSEGIIQKSKGKLEGDITRESQENITGGNIKSVGKMSVNINVFMLANSTVIKPYM